MSETDSCVCKRRKFQKFDVAILSEDAVGGSDKAIENGNNYDCHHLEDLIGTPYVKQINLTAGELVDSNDSPGNEATGGNKVHAELSITKFQKLDLESMGDFHSTKELCIFILKSHGLLGVTSESVSCVSLEVIDGLTSKSNLLCKLCYQSGSPSGMLICDLCEEAFHINCLNPKINKIPIDEWNCQPCSRNKPNVPEQGLSISCGDLSSIAFILRDKLPYTTGVRIGKDFQAEVSEWSGPVPDEEFHPFEEPLEVDFAECSLTASNFNKQPKSDSVGNWIQCREIVYSGDDDEGTICGKWRRAPLFLLQTDDWDCSSAIPWDPDHADCAVPQELPTEEVMRHLKFVETLRSRLADRKQKFG
ncbi:uncharacterized protein LOC121976088 isoform X1 [Zingiber officinale]|uniref:uncharacterized protein LOC121976088 isoform X1 n=1 Tax=Zingiber officinale TaxID=94328 RepID=UPI001C4CE9EA|nr:uncharacterized protein LOC121976088 isoform X1 [Zingiber officinale]XP_042384020.1 uncharacterized protein LOC121976088 isoform X1 [Zingiber officinale]XP_042384021.1 uncharacterized protein LOC121976088 isoform X1 [Zingiber officinale]XP_042384022.1 uncharacterized protein LOC121976088 isoform X1 [Zingiber officinale]